MFWDQNGIQVTHKVEISRTLLATKPAIRKHFEDLNDCYGRVHVVSLLKVDFYVFLVNIQKSPSSGEYFLGDGYKQMLSGLNSAVTFTEFDFHAIVGRDNYAKV